MKTNFDPICSVHFGPLETGDSSTHSSKEFELKDTAEDYLESLRRNGQVSSEELICVVDGILTAYITVPEADAWSVDKSSRYGIESLSKVVHAFGQPPVWKMVGQERPKPAHWQDENWFFLESCGRSRSCLWIGGKPQSIPYYQLPMESDRLERLVFWSRDASRLLGLWHSGTLEMEVWRELADPRSQTAKTGRSLAAEVEKAIGKPVYFKLDRYYSFAPDEEAERRCPGCGQSWRMAEQDQVHRLDFQCHPCRLVSNIGNNPNDPPAEHIGYEEMMKSDTADFDSEKVSHRPILS